MHIALYPNMYVVVDSFNHWTQLTIASDPQSPRLPTMFRVKQCINNFDICVTKYFDYVDLLTVNLIGSALFRF